MILYDNMIIDKKLSIEDIAKIIGTNVDNLDIRIENGKIVAYDERGIGTIFLEPGQKISREELGNKRVYTNGHIQDPVMNENRKTLDDILFDKKAEVKTLNERIRDFFKKDNEINRG